MYAHGSVSLGAVVAAMIATSGDEAFVMFALIPRTALWLNALLVAVGIAAGGVVDLAAGKRPHGWPHCPALVVHGAEQPLRLSRSRVLAQWRDCSAARGTLTTALGLFAGAVAAGWIGPPEWTWIRISLLVVSGASLYVVITAPDHFLEEHLWRHVARKHVPRVFFWTVAALAASGGRGHCLEPVARAGQPGRRPPVRTGGVCASGTGLYMRYHCGSGDPSWTRLGHPWTETPPSEPGWKACGTPRWRPWECRWWSCR